MKILCMIIILANISLFLWEYRSGELDSKKQELELETTLSKGNEKILLISELKSDKPLQPGSNPPAIQDSSDKKQEINSDAQPSIDSADKAQDLAGEDSLP